VSSVRERKDRIDEPKRGKQREKCADMHFFDNQWEKIKDFLPGRDGHVVRTAKNNRLFVEAVLYRS